MNIKNKLVQLLKASLFSLLLVAMPTAYGEYYIVAGGPSTCCTVAQPIWVPRHRVHHHYHRCHHRHHYWAPHRRSMARVDVYYVFPNYGCCTRYTPYYVGCDNCSSIHYREACTYTDSCNSGIDDDTGIYLDRRTADDVGVDMDIDY